MTDKKLVKELFEIPEHISKGDFVVKLADGVRHPAVTAKTYVVTKPLLNAFHDALKLIGSALSDNKSKAAFLHGSFGSGKSHFMAMLSLMLDNNEIVWSTKKDLHPLKESHSFIGKSKLMQLRYHVIGHKTLEEAVFSGYIEYVTKHHPDQQIPPLFADEGVFEDAKKMLDSMGDTTFFEKINAGQPSIAGLGEFGQADTWNRERFEQAAKSTDPKTRAELFDALARSWFGSYKEGHLAYRNFDEGLGVLSQHAESLGYQGVILFLDELILWLAKGASSPQWLNDEAQKMVKLVEAKNVFRPVPLISFIARQRDLAKMVGEQYAGIENALLRDSLNWGKGRYDTITIQDENLPDIVEQRILIPKNDQAREILQKTFEQVKKEAGLSWNILLGKDDAEAFRKLYPFSPALVEALIALSNSLQRERTAIKLLMEILHSHIEDLPLGKLVGVGDLFDLLAGGDDTADGVMRSRFESAKQIYEYQLLPLIQKEQGTDKEEKCQRLRKGHPKSLGCSNCPEEGCRTNNRLAKTLLLAALVPEVKAFKDLTASRLARLNHGSITAPIQGEEATRIVPTLRQWSASKVAQLRVGEGKDPSISLLLEGVDTAPILEQFKEKDTPLARKRIIRNMVFNAMGIDEGEEYVQEKKIEWRKTDRKGVVQFGNVRQMTSEQLHCPGEYKWKLVVDYPFDDLPYTPASDLERVEQVRNEGTGSWTLCWLPSFFSSEINDLVGELAILEQILHNKSSQQQAVAHLSPDNQARAINDLQNLKSSKEGLVRVAMNQAYGIARFSKDTSYLDPARSLDVHLHVLKPGAKLQEKLIANFSSAVDIYAQSILEARYPRHPKFTVRITPKRVEQLSEKFGQIVDAADKRITVDSDTAALLQGSLAELGLVRVTEGTAHLVEDRVLQEIENTRNQQGAEPPSVAQIRSFHDPNKRRGLEPVAADLVVRAYARYAARTFQLLDKPYRPDGGKPLADDVVLVKPELPEQTEWQQAIERAGHLFGATLPGKALHAENLNRFSAQIDAKLDQMAAYAAELPNLLDQWAQQIDVDLGSDRLVTARSAGMLVNALQDRKPVDQVRELAAFDCQTSVQAMGKSLATASGNVTVLKDKLVQSPIWELSQDSENRSKAQELLRQDELHQPLAKALRDIAVESMSKPPPPPPPPPIQEGEKIVFNQKVSAKGQSELQERLRETVDAIENKDLGEDDELEATVEVRKRN